MNVQDWLLAVLMTAAFIGGLYGIIAWAERQRRKQIHELVEAIRARGVKRIVIDTEEG